MLELGSKGREEEVIERSVKEGDGGLIGGEMEQEVVAGGIIWLKGARREKQSGS